MRNPKPTAVPLAAFSLACAAAFALAAFFPCLATAQPQVQPAQPAVQVAQASRAPASRAPAQPRAKRLTKPLWGELTPAQQQALAPLAAKWDTVSAAQKRKWLALSQNYPTMSVDEQSKLHSRMSEWVALSPQQRARARLNFAQAQRLSPDDKRAKWEAYQALSPEEKRKLAAKAPKPPTTAAAVKPVAPSKLAVVPRDRHRQQQDKTPRIAVAPSQLDHNTLLPQQQPGAAGQLELP